MVSPDRSPSLTEYSLNSADPDLGTRFFFHVSCFQIIIEHEMAMKHHFSASLDFGIHQPLRLANWTCARVQEALEPSNVIPTCLFAMKD